METLRSHERDQENPFQVEVLNPGTTSDLISARYLKARTYLERRLHRVLQGQGEERVNTVVPIGTVSIECG